MANKTAHPKLQLLTRPLNLGMVVYFGRYYTMVRVEPSGLMWLHYLKKN